MDGVTCDMCGKMLLGDEDTRYLVRIEVFAAYDTMEVTREDLERDRGDELARLLERVEQMDAAELEDQVYREFRFDLCPPCQKKYLADPLALRRSAGPEQA